MFDYWRVHVPIPDVAQKWHQDGLNLLANGEWSQHHVPRGSGFFQTQRISLVVI